MIDENNAKDVDEHQLMAVLDDLMMTNDELVNILADNNAIMLNPELLEEEAILEASLKEEEDEIERLKEEMLDPAAKQEVENMQDDIAEQMEQMHSLEEGAENADVVGDDLSELGDLAGISEVEPSPENLEVEELQDTILEGQVDMIEVPEVGIPADTAQTPENIAGSQEVVKIEIIDSEEELPKTSIVKKIEEKIEPEPTPVVDPYEFDETLEEQEIVKMHQEDKTPMNVEEKSRDSEEDVYEDAKEVITDVNETITMQNTIKEEVPEETVESDDDTLADLQEEAKKEAELSKRFV